MVTVESKDILLQVSYISLLNLLSSLLWALEKMTWDPESIGLPPEQIGLSFFHALVISIRKFANLVLTTTNHNQKVKKAHPLWSVVKLTPAIWEEKKQSKHRTAGASALFMWALLSVKHECKEREWFSEI